MGIKWRDSVGSSYFAPLFALRFGVRRCRAAFRCTKQNSLLRHDSYLCKDGFWSGLRTSVLFHPAL